MEWPTSPKKRQTVAPGFDSLPLSQAALANIKSLGWEAMTPIQAQALPLVLAGNDVIGRARTGSGKTGAFGLGLLEGLDAQESAVQALILCPTRELAEQVGKEVRRLAQAMANVKLVLLCGGKPIGPQKVTLRHGAHIVVGTPGRVLDHLSRGTLQLDGLRTLVLDEADRMLDMGFADDMQMIIERAPKNRQTLLFSATFPDAIAAMSRSVQRNPKSVTVDVDHAKGVIDTLFYEVGRRERNEVLLALFEHYQFDAAVVFCKTKLQCAEVAEFLNSRKIEAVALHGDLDQRQRDLMLTLFANGSSAVLVATDVAARGLDIKDLPAVINYELPHDPEVYVHRIGRTGRAGAKGVALSLFTEAEQKRVQLIGDSTGNPCLIDVPASLDRQPDFRLAATMATLQLDVGRKNKIRPGDVLGALTGDGGLNGADIGKINIQDHYTFVAFRRETVKAAQKFFNGGKIKGRSVRARRVS